VAACLFPTRRLSPTPLEGADLEKSSDKKQAWEPMTIKYVGDAGELLAGGTGKKSPVPTDPGEVFKEPGHG
jgi:hypothetical protein